MDSELETCGCCNLVGGVVGLMDVPVCHVCSYHRQKVLADEMDCPLKRVFAQDLEED